MKLAAPSNIYKIELAARSQSWIVQGSQVRVQVGSSAMINASDPVCTEINQLTRPGLVEYECDQGVHKGQYVIISSTQRILTICEAKVLICEKENNKCQGDINLWSTFHS